MLFKKTVLKIPFVGNLVKTKYLRQNLITKYFVVMEANSVRLFMPFKGFYKSAGLIITDSELHEAHIRFIRYNDRICDGAKKNPLGKFTLDYPIKTTRPGNPILRMNIVFFCKDGSRQGFIFSDTELAAIYDRTAKLEKAICFPRWYQKILLWFNRLK